MVCMEKKIPTSVVYLANSAKGQSPLYLDAFLPPHPILSQQNSLVITKETSRLRVASS